MEDFWTAPVMEPYIAFETPSYLVLYKPPRMHTVPLREGEDNTLLAWAARLFPEIVKLRGRKEIEGGIVHRLDYETQGLVLCARTEEVFMAFFEQQAAGNIIKEYEAVCHVDCDRFLSGFPPFPGTISNTLNIIESAFRPFGTGRKEVRPVLKNNSSNKPQTLYRTEIAAYTETQARACFSLRIHKGFRHQIRCHLAWINRPIFNDPVYGVDWDHPGSENFLALRASSIVFSDPHTKKHLRISAAR